MNTSLRYKIILWTLSLTDPIPWLIVSDKTTSILDVGCGTGMPMKLIKLRHHVGKTVGVDIFRKSLEKAKREKIYAEYLVEDARKLSFRNKSFDIVMALQVLEHMPKKDALFVLSRLERIARKQVIVATPLGWMQNEEVDGNKYMLHRSSFQEKDFIQRGYKTRVWGNREIDHFLYSNAPEALKKCVQLFALVFSALYFLFPNLATMYIYAWKDMSKKKL